MGITRLAYAVLAGVGDHETKAAIPIDQSGDRDSSSSAKVIEKYLSIPYGQ